MNFKDIQKYNNGINMYNNNRFNTGNDIFMSRDLPVNQEVGYIVLLTFTERGQFVVPGALVTVYARYGEDEAFVSSLTTQSYPITIRLPVSHPSGSLIMGPEYYFTTYDLSIEAERFCPVRVFNIRIFPGITEKLDINMVESPQDATTVPETIITFPPHERDIVNSQRYRR